MLSGTLTWSNLDTFTGTFVNNSPHTGDFTSPTSSLKYTGDYDSSDFHGHGTLIISNFSTYTGSFLSGKKAGQGQIHYKNLTSYTGEFENDMYSGLGTFYNSEGVKEFVGTWKLGSKYYGCDYFNDGFYKGYFLEDKYHGRGIYSNGKEEYEGEYVNGMRTGFGKLTRVDVIKEGGFRENRELDGDWLILYKDGSKFAGECVGGEPEGRGILKYSNGDVYSGMFKNGLRDGVGVLVFSDGGEYEGDFSLDQPVGLQFFQSSSPTKTKTKHYESSTTEITLSDICLSDNENENESKKPPTPDSPITSKLISSKLPKYTYPNSDIYYGLLTPSSLRTGFGVYITQSPSARYEGQFVDNIRHGTGTFTTSSSVFTGMFENGRMKKGNYIVNKTFVYEGGFNEEGLFHDREACYVDLNGNVFKGGFVDGVKEGYGVLELNDGITKFEGEFKKGRKEGKGILRKNGTVVFEGEWREDVYHGFGVLNEEEGGGRYEGNFAGGEIDQSRT
ncbi:hypothetical protein TL16_g10465 [Triparma laevis f. inornata]|uniref:Uncharacterized protein n=1 Tax=Triparma laevis f. inornata TaxID=1714386 RepID=A0A9W7ENZ0_9STRA|nr:hypothetical protein TL16_g10465 [Triparma laevis f. inornata]